MEANNLTATLCAFPETRPLRSGERVFHTGVLLREGHTFRFNKKFSCTLADQCLTFESLKNSDSKVSCTVESAKRGHRKLEIAVTVKDTRGGSTNIFVFAQTASEFDAWLAKFSKCANRDPNSYYTFSRELGSGAFGTVFKGAHKKTGEVVAIKKMRRSEFSAQELQQIVREIYISTSVQHPNLVQAFDIFENADYLFIVMEFCDGGPLYNVLAMQAKFSEKDAAEAMHQIISGVQYLHDHGVVHRDLKSENVLCKGSSFPLHCMLADFGLSRALDSGFDDEEDALHRSMVGTPAFVAPEILRKQSYGPPVDMWSCGVILWNMLTGKYPFFGSSKQETLDLVLAGKYKMEGRIWTRISPEAQSLIKGLLQSDPKKRLSAIAALNHDFFTLKREEVALDHGFSDCLMPSKGCFDATDSLMKPNLTALEKFRKASQMAIIINKLEEIARDDWDDTESDDDFDDYPEDNLNTDRAATPLSGANDMTKVLSNNLGDRGQRGSNVNDSLRKNSSNRPTRLHSLQVGTRNRVASNLSIQQLQQLTGSNLGVAAEKMPQQGGSRTPTERTGPVAGGGSVHVVNPPHAVKPAK
eukprot:CAMPEP_0184711642 /NCGR_PEP_ID=MMETSP0314-20130426/2288_1 /TAXON_ID=38298 /ORGANISM="Rhodella maculata, Strain CCMP 736" /LENGTH=584 /DNA_ID=CAMNT_0027173843 /DNA_START=56 /DNA_END=1807 /DNA_ORIENTATION=-